MKTKTPRPNRKFWPRFWEKFSTDETTTLAASLAFYTALSMAPLLILFVTVCSLLDPVLLGEFQMQIQTVMGADAAQAVRMVFNSAKTHQNLTSLAGAFGAITLLLSASLIFGELRFALNRIFGVKAREPKRPGFVAASVLFVEEKLLHIGLALAFIAVLVVSVTASSLISGFLRSDKQFYATVLNVGISFVFYVALFSLVFRYLPDRRQAWWHTFKGATFTAVLFVFGKELVGLYLGTSAVGSAYGAAGSFVALMVWVYYSTLITFVGAHISAIWSTAR